MSNNDSENNSETPLNTILKIAKDISKKNLFSSSPIKTNGKQTIIINKEITNTEVKKIQREVDKKVYEIIKRKKYVKMISKNNRIDLSILWIIPLSLLLYLIVISIIIPITIVLIFIAIIPFVIINVFTKSNDNISSKICDQIKRCSSAFIVSTLVFISSAFIYNNIFYKSKQNQNTKLINDRKNP